MRQRRLEIKVIHSQGEGPQTFEIPIKDNNLTKYNLFVFRGEVVMGEKEIQDLVEISTRMSGNPCTALILREDDKFEVYEVEIPTRYAREPVI
jgi:hypothetical protein